MRATKKQTDQRLINWAVYQLRGMQLNLPAIRSIPLEIAYQQFKTAKNELLAALKKEHLK